MDCGRGHVISSVVERSLHSGRDDGSVIYVPPNETMNNEIKNFAFGGAAARRG